MSPFETHGYGPSPAQVGDLYLPSAAPAPVICLLHGGYWRLPYGRDHIAPLAAALMSRGFAVWNLEYRRVGEEGGGWPGTFEDVAAGMDHLATLAERGAAIDVTRVTTVGHSAGGHLALWAAAAGEGPDAARRIRAAAAVGLAPVADLAWAYERGCGAGAVEQLMGGAPAEWPARYGWASPAQRLPLRVPQLLIHGTPDEDVPVDISRRYARAAGAAGDAVTFIELESATHMDCVDPLSEVSLALYGWLASR